VVRTEGHQCRTNRWIVTTNRSKTLRAAQSVREAVGDQRLWKGMLFLTHESHRLWSRKEKSTCTSLGRHMTISRGRRFVVLHWWYGRTAIPQLENAGSCLARKIATGSPRLRKDFDLIVDFFQLTQTHSWSRAIMKSMAHPFPCYPTAHAKYRMLWLKGLLVPSVQIYTSIQTTQKYFNPSSTHAK
jgi:hypothetical protein